MQQINQSQFKDTWGSNWVALITVLPSLSPSLIILTPSLASILLQERMASHTKTQTSLLQKSLSSSETSNKAQKRQKTASMNSLELHHSDLSASTEAIRSMEPSPPLQKSFGEALKYWTSSAVPLKGLGLASILTWMLQRMLSSN